MSSTAWAAFLACVLLCVAAPVASARKAYVTNIASDTVSAFDSATRALIGTPITTGAGAGTQPFGVAITPNGATAYVSNSAPTLGTSVTPIDVATDTQAVPVFPVGVGPVGVAVTPDGKRAYVASRDTGTVSVIDTATNALVGSPITVGNAGSADRGVAITPDGAHVYVARFGDDSLSVIDTATNTVVGAPIPVGDGPRELAVTPDGKRLYVTNNNNTGTGNSVTVVDTATNTTIGTPIPVGTGPRGIAITPDGSHAYVANNVSGTVSVIDTATNTVVGAPIPVGTSPVGVAITPDGSLALVANQAASPNNTIFPIATSTNTAGTSFQSGGDSPSEIAVVPDQPPKASFKATHKRKKPTRETFNGSASTDPDGSVARFDWNFGDGKALANGGPTPSHTYKKPGKYTATLTLTDNEGCSTKLVFTGQTASCNGSGVAAASQKVGIPPQTKIKKHPEKLTTSLTAEFKFKANEKGTKFKCALDGKKKFKKCRKNFQTTVEPGAHKLRVEAVGKGGADPTPAKFKWVVLP